MAHNFQITPSKKNLKVVKGFAILSMDILRNIASIKKNLTLKLLESKSRYFISVPDCNLETVQWDYY